MYLVCGEALFDFFLKNDDGSGGLDFDARAGGSPFNVAIGVARRGGSAAFFSGLSTDMLGERLVALMRKERIETRYLVRSGRRTTLSLVDLSTGQPAYAFYGLGSADCAVSEADLPALGPEITGLHFGSYSIAVDPVASAFATLAEREAERFISLDPNVRLMVAPDPALWRRRIEALLPVVNFVKLSMEDMALLYPDTRADALAALWLRRGPSLVIVTDGGEAAIAYTERLRLEIAPPKVEVVDTVGAGDAFQATMLAGLAQSGAPADLDALSEAALHALVTEAATVAAQTCARRGADIPFA